MRFVPPLKEGWGAKLTEFMAQKKKVASSPPLEPQALLSLLPTQILTGPKIFARQLNEVEPIGWRYAAIVLLSAVLSGIAYALLVSHAEGIIAQQTKSTVTGFSTFLTNVIGSVFLTGFSFTLMWALGYIGVRREGRPAEVYGATFAIFPPLWLIIIVLTLFIPATAWAVPPEVLEKAGSDLTTLRSVAYLATMQVPVSFLMIIVTLGGTLAQFGLAVVAFKELTGRRSRALLGILLPLIPVLAVQIIGISPLIGSFLHLLSAK